MTGRLYRSGTPIPAEVVASIRLAFAAGTPIYAIAKDHGVAKSTVSHYIGDDRVPCPQCGQPKAKMSNSCRRCVKYTGLGWAYVRNAELLRKEGKFLTGETWRCEKAESGAHHWVLDERCRGVCRCCGVERQFMTQLRADPADLGRR